jgi:hypothetical protein
MEGVEALRIGLQASERMVKNPVVLTLRNNRLSISISALAFLVFFYRKKQLKVLFGSSKWHF